MRWAVWGAATLMVTACIGDNGWGDNGGSLWPETSSMVQGPGSPTLNKILAGGQLPRIEMFWRATSAKTRARLMHEEEPTHLWWALVGKAELNSAGDLPWSPEQRGFAQRMVHELRLQQLLDRQVNPEGESVLPGLLNLFEKAAKAGEPARPEHLQGFRQRIEFMVASGEHVAEIIEHGERGKMASLPMYLYQKGHEHALQMLLEIGLERRQISIDTTFLGYNYQYQTLLETAVEEYLFTTNPWRHFFARHMISVFLKLGASPDVAIPRIHYNSLRRFVEDCKQRAELDGKVDAKLLATDVLDLFAGAPLQKDPLIEAVENDDVDALKRVLDDHTPADVGSWLTTLLLKRPYLLWSVMIGLDHSDHQFFSKWGPAQQLLAKTLIDFKLVDVARDFAPDQRTVLYGLLVEADDAANPHRTEKTVNIEDYKARVIFMIDHGASIFKPCDPSSREPMIFTLIREGHEFAFEWVLRLAIERGFAIDKPLRDGQGQRLSVLEYVVGRLRLAPSRLEEGYLLRLCDLLLAMGADPWLKNQRTGESLYAKIERVQHDAPLSGGIQQARQLALLMGKFDRVRAQRKAGHSQCAAVVKLDPNAPQMAN